MKTLITLIAIISSFCVSQNVSAQTVCNGNKILMNDAHCCVKGGCHTKCVSPAQVQNYLDMGWKYGSCTCGPCMRFGEDESMANTTNSYLSVYPNPVANISMLSFSLDQSQRVSIQIFDLHGRLIASLADKIFDAGGNDLVWDASDVSEGIYFLQFKSDEMAMTQKIVVAKN